MYKEPITPKQIALHSLLFLLATASAIAAGADWRGYPGLSGWEWYWSGLEYGLLFIGILSFHEFGHYYFARKYGVPVSLPYYIPFWLPGMLTIGTFGAFIRMKRPPQSTREMFDIGIAGPLAGLVVALAIFLIGLATLPGPEYLLKIHPEYAAYGDKYAETVYSYPFMQKRDAALYEQMIYKDSIAFVEKTKLEQPDARAEYKREGTYTTPKGFVEVETGSNFLMEALVALFGLQERFPNSFELFHYPWLFAAYLAFFVTALNLFPIGQLDGGHVVFGLFGHKVHRIVSLTTFSLLLFYGGIGIFKGDMLGFRFDGGQPYEMAIFMAIYLFFLFWLYQRAFENRITALLFASVVLGAQYVVGIFMPEAEGFQGWLVYGILLGRVVGIGHPKVALEQKLDLKRKILGWIALLAFILCFTPEVMNLVNVMP
jgi:membrane-associated protease RseP (regulator of RpoE activity)